MVRMISAVHSLIYSDDPDATRAFFRDVLGLASVDAHDGWLIFKLPPAELGIHPAGPESPGGLQQLFLMCDDITKTVSELEAKGVEVSSPPANQGFGIVTSFPVPGIGELGLYQARHPVAYDLSD
jgi:catechol 2,3-dioxygenase-like lactoylglutathione lyase family enzyme